MHNCAKKREDIEQHQISAACSLQMHTTIFFIER